MTEPEAESFLTELALRWEDLRAEGREVTPESLCADRPELVEALRQRLAELKAMEGVLGGLTGYDDLGPGREGSPPLEPLPPPCPSDFEILGELGQGGMGVVYRAYDRRRGEVVALKTIQGLDPSTVDRFKREFRAAADLSHPNLVSLHGLVREGRLWFFTMELVEGVHFPAYVRKGQGEAGTDLIARLRPAMAQLAQGLGALHEAGHLHRDVKPSNVLVQPDGRVVLLDFGLAAELGPSGLHRSTDRVVRGTVAYMSPEQAEGKALSPASDWYSVGVMLHEALTGRLPFEGRGGRALASFRRAHPPCPKATDPSTPDDLDTLCQDLLRDNPAARPDGQEILRRLGATLSSPTDSLATGSPTPLLFGRDRHLATLAACLDIVSAGQAAVVRVHGPSGSGKSILLHEFIEMISARGAVVVLSGRCHEREAVPYKAIDGLIDALAGHLRRLGRAEVESLLPRDVLSLARVFPALKRVEAVALAPRRGFDVPDPRELRRRAFAGLRELLGRLGARGPLVLALDDLQWGDVDSASALAEVLRGPDAPWLLLLACHRDEDVESSPFLRAFLGLADQIGPGVDWRALTVEPLARADALAMAGALLGDSAPPSDLEAVARESGGNPYYVTELVGSIQEGNALGKAASVSSLDEVLRERFQRLPASARFFLEVVAVAGGPILREVAVRAAGLSPTEERLTVGRLTTARLIRSAGAPGLETIETYHDRVRVAMTAGLESEVPRDHHRRLAEALEAIGGADPEALARHFQGAGEPALASRQYARAATVAADALAFDRAARLYRLALDLGTGLEADSRPLCRKLGDALANAGRGHLAALAYLDAANAPETSAAESFDLRRLAAWQWLVSGHVDEGLAALRDLLDTLGWCFQSSPRRSRLAFLYRRICLRLRGRSFRRRAVAEVDPSDLAKIDVCWAAAAGLTVVDYVRAADFQARGLLLALRAGEINRVARAVAMEAAHSATAGGRARERTTRLLTEARALAIEAGEPYAQAMADLAEGSAAYLQGRWRIARTACDRASALFRERCTGVSWETVTAESFALWALSHLGEYAELSARWPSLLRQGAERGDLYAVMNMNTYLMSTARLAADDPEGAAADLSRNATSWSRGSGFHIQHGDELWAMAQVALYRGDGTGAWVLLQARWPALRRSLLLRVQFLRVAMTWLRARCALGALAGLVDPVEVVPVRLELEVEEAAGRLLAEGMPWASALGTWVSANLAATLGDREKATKLLAEAEDALNAGDMRVYAAAARRHRGVLTPGTRGLDLIATADAILSARAVRNPRRMAAMLAPGIENFPG